MKAQSLRCRGCHWIWVVLGEPPDDSPMLGCPMCGCQEVIDLKEWNTEDEEETMAATYCWRDKTRVCMEACVAFVEHVPRRNCAVHEIQVRQAEALEGIRRGLERRS